MFVQNIVLKEQN